MSRGLWVLAAMGLATVLILAFASQRMAVQVGGVEEAAELQAVLRGAYAEWIAPEPPLRVYRMPPAGEWKGFRWKVEATLPPGRDPRSAEVRRGFVDRVVARCLRTEVMKRPPAGVLVLLRDGRGGEHRFLVDGRGRSVEEPLPGEAPR